MTYCPGDPGGPTEDMLSRRSLPGIGTSRAKGVVLRGTILSIALPQPWYYYTRLPAFPGKESFISHEELESSTGVAREVIRVVLYLL